MSEHETVTVTTTRRWFDAKRPYRIAAGVFGPLGIVMSVVVLVAFDDIPLSERLFIAAVNFVGGVVFSLAAFGPRSALARSPGTSVETRRSDTESAA
jgi:hypothetical protein